MHLLKTDALNLLRRGNSRKAVELFLEKLQPSGQIEEFVKEGAYFSSRSLKQRVWRMQFPRNYRSKNMLIMKFASHIAT